MKPTPSSVGQRLAPLLSWLALWLFGLASTPAFAQKWQLIQPRYPSTSTFVAGFSVADYGATGDGVTDVTTIFQGRLDALRKLGGGTLFVPQGKYVIKGNLTIPKGITLRGEWRAPVKGQPIVGTILLAYAGRGDEKALPFIIMQTSAAVQDLAIWYPEQQPNAIVPYPMTIAFGQPGFSGNEFCNAKNITLVNAYAGVVVRKGGTTPIINGLYGTPLSRGVEIDFISDVGHLENINFSPAYWVGSGLPGAPAAGSAFESWMYQNGTGIVMRRNDWTYTSFVDIEGYSKGFYAATSLSTNDPGKPNGTNYAFTLTRCKTGVYLENTGGVGIMFTRITTTGCETGVYAAPGANSAMQLHTSNIAGSASAITIAAGSKAKVMLQQCTIGAGAVRAAGGTLTASDCDFNNAAPQITLEADARGIITANRFKNPVKIQNNSDYVCAIDQTPVSISKLPDFPVIKPETRKPAGPGFWVVTDAPFGAKADGVTDNTRAIQQALDAAGAQGGGVVFLPPGKYKVLGNLQVPGGVELKGSMDNSTSATEPGSTLEVYAGRGNENGPAFMQLAANSGVRGITFNYPEQRSDQVPTVPAYPYCLQATGANVYVINVAMRAVYNGVDLFSYKCDNHYVDYLAGHVFRRGIVVGGGSNGGKIYNAQFNPISYAFGYEDKFGFWPNSKQGSSPAVGTYGKDNTDFITLGGCTNEVLYNDFIVLVKRGLVLGTPDGPGPTGLQCLNLGIDAARTSIDFVKGGATPYTFINTQLVSVGDTTTQYLRTEPTFNSTAYFYGIDLWGVTGRAVSHAGGTINMQLANFNDPVKVSFASLKPGSALNLYNSLVRTVPALLDKGNEPRFSAKSSIIDDTRITVANTQAWLNNLSNTWIRDYRPVDLPGRLEAENYNTGGQGVAYNDTEPANKLGQYRPTEGVDIEQCSEGGYNVGEIRNGEWLKYDVNVTQAGVYQLSLRLASPTGNQFVRVELDGQEIVGRIAVPQTGGYQSWQTVTVPTTPLPAGRHTLRVVMEGDLFNFDNLTFGINKLVDLPGQLEAEDYNAGGQDVGYSDIEPANISGKYRPTEGVDVENCSEGGYNVGYIREGEWLRYDVNVTQAGPYQLALRLASPISNQFLRVELDGQDISGQVAVPNTGGFQAWQTVTLTTLVPLPGGVHTVRVLMEGGRFNLNYFSFRQPAAARITAIERAADGGTVTYANPVGEQLTYTVPAAMQRHTVRVRSLTGQTVFTRTYAEAASTRSIDAAAWPAGIYVVEVGSGPQTQTFKIVKQ